MLIGIETAVPPYIVKQNKAADELKKRMSVQPVTGRLIDMAASQSGIEKRHIVIPDAEDTAEEKFYSKGGTYFSPDTRCRMEEYERWSKKLAAEAVRKLIENENINVNEINRLITISCTGFFAPGLDQYIIEQFNIRRDVKRTNIGFMGCAASIIGINSVLEAFTSIKEKPCNVLLISVELCSIHLQTEPSRDNILANMIFADGCAAAYFSNKSNKCGAEIICTRSVLFPESTEYMGWKIGNRGFEMVLSSNLPKIIETTAAPELLGILEAEGLSKEKITHWALHPGGRAILDSLQRGIGLTDADLRPSREVLRKYGNMSSASILFVLKEILDSGGIGKDEYCCAAAFGPGLTMEVAILKG